MKINFLFISVITLIISSCSHKINIAQTPDDVYFSPVTESVGYVKRERRRDDNYLTSENREIFMSRFDRRWRFFVDDYNNYSYDPYHYGYNYGYYYNPYYYPYPVYDYGTTLIDPRNNPPRTTNLSSYQFQQNFIVPKSGPIQFPQPVRSYNNSNTDYNNPRNTISPTYNTEHNNTRTYSPSSNNNSSNNNGGTPIVRPSRN
jgi:hypothetical protein